MSNLRAIKQPYRLQAGFSLVEALVAFLVLAGGLLALARFQANVITATAEAKARSEALNLAQAKIEEFRNFNSPLNFDSLVQSGSAQVQTDYSGTVFAETYARAWTVVGEDATDGSTAIGENDPHRSVTVAVTWKDRRGKARSVTLQSAIKRGDPFNSGVLLKYLESLAATSQAPPD